MKQIAIALLMISISSLIVMAQHDNNTAVEKRVPLTEPAVAFDVKGTPTLEARLITTSLNGAPDMPVTNIRIAIRNLTTTTFAFASGVVTFYDASGVRCGEGVFKADVLAANEQFETDSPGLRIRCVPVTWRVMATDMVPRGSSSESSSGSRPSGKLVISIDGEQHPLQLDKPIRLRLGDKQRTIIVREAP